MDLERVVVVGASLAGLRACETLRTEGYTGAITLVGNEPEVPYDRPPLSKKLLAGEWEPDRVRLRKEADCRVARPRPASRRRRPSSSTPPSGR